MTNPVERIFDDINNQDLTEDELYEIAFEAFLDGDSELEHIAIMAIREKEAQNEQ